MARIQYPLVMKKEMVQAVEEMLAKHNDSTTDRVVQHEIPNYANVLKFFF